MEGIFYGPVTHPPSRMWVVKFTIPHHKTLELHKSKNLLLLWFIILANLPTEIKYSTSVIKVDEPYLLVGFSTLIPLALIRV